MGATSLGDMPFPGAINGPADLGIGFLGVLLEVCAAETVDLGVEGEASRREMAGLGPMGGPCRWEIVFPGVRRAMYPLKQGRRLGLPAAF